MRMLWTLIVAIALCCSIGCSKKETATEAPDDKVQDKAGSERPDDPGLPITGGKGNDDPKTPVPGSTLTDPNVPPPVPGPAEPPTTLTRSDGGVAADAEP